MYVRSREGYVVCRVVARVPVSCQDRGQGWGVRGHGEGGRLGDVAKHAAALVVGDLRLGQDDVADRPIGSIRQCC